MRAKFILLATIVFLSLIRVAHSEMYLGDYSGKTPVGDYKFTVPASSVTPWVLKIFIITGTAKTQYTLCVSRNAWFGCSLIPGDYTANVEIDKWRNLRILMPAMSANSVTAYLKNQKGQIIEKTTVAIQVKK